MEFMELQVNKLKRVFCSFPGMKEAMGWDKAEVIGRAFVLFLYKNLLLKKKKKKLSDESHSVD